MNKPLATDIIERLYMTPMWHETSAMNSHIVHFCSTIMSLTHWGQDGRYFADDVLKCIFLIENVWISLKIPLKFVPRGPINNIPALVQIMAWSRPGDKPLCEAMLVFVPTHICIARPQWVNEHKEEGQCQPCETTSENTTSWIFPVKFLWISTQFLLSLHVIHEILVRIRCNPYCFIDKSLVIRKMARCHHSNKPLLKQQCS